MPADTRSAADASIVIVSFNTRELLRECLRSMESGCEGSVTEVFVVDNCSSDGSAEMVRTEFANVQLLKNRTNAGFAAANNRAMQVATGRYVVLLNSDTYLRDAAITMLVQFMDSHPQAGYCGPRLLNPDGTLQSSARRFPTPLSSSFSLLGWDRRYPHSRHTLDLHRLHEEHEAFRADWVSGACLVVRTSAIPKAGMLDDGFFLYFEETDWCRKMALSGYEGWYVPSAEVLHHGGQSVNAAQADAGSCGDHPLHWAHSRRRYMRRYYGTIGLMLDGTLHAFFQCLRWARHCWRRDDQSRSKARCAAAALGHQFRQPSLRDHAVNPVSAAPSPSAGIPPATPLISVVVIGRNEGERLARCLESVRAADYPPDRIDLEYVDSGSTDGSCERAAQFGARVLKVQGCRVGAAAARNVGLGAARHDLIHFLDGDTILDSHWLRKAVGLLETTGAACVFGCRTELEPNKSWYMRVASLEWYVRPGPALFCGGDALFRRSALTQVGGFDESLIAGEEPEMCYRMRRAGATIWRCDEPMTSHDLNITRFQQYWRRAVRSGWAYAVVGAICRIGPERIWIRRSLATVVEFAAWAVLIIGALALPDVRLLWVFGVLVLLRTVWIGCKVHARAAGWGTALLYGIHCQFMRIPLLVGQLRGWWFLLRRHPSALIEYKD